MTAPVILVVEDERLVARDICMLLQDFGYTPVGPATTGEQALAMAATCSPQLVLMDVHLGSAMDGITAAQTLRSQFGIACIFLSAFSVGEQLERAKLTQPLGYLGKPFLEVELRDALAAAFKALEARHE